MKKKIFAVPTTECLSLKAEGVVCTSPNAYTTGGGGSYDEGSTNENGDY